MFENLIKNKLNIKEQDNLLIIKYKKRSLKIPLYLLTIYIFYTWIGCTTKGIARTEITLYLYNFPFLLISGIIVLIICSKEILIVDSSKITIERYFLFYLYERKVIDVEDIRSIFFADEYEKNYPLFLPLDIIRNLKIRVKESEIEDKVYTFGVSLDKEKYKKIVEKILKYNSVKIL